MHYSITSSTRASNIGVTARPSGRGGEHEHIRRGRAVHMSPNAFLRVGRSGDTEVAALKSLGRSGRPSFLGSLQGRDVGQSGFECELALFGAEADALSTYEREVADADEPEETRQECFLMIHKGHRRRGGVESTTGRGDDQLLSTRETLHAGRGVLEGLAGRGKAIDPGL